MLYTNRDTAAVVCQNNYIKSGGGQPQYRALKLLKNVMPENTGHGISNVR